MPRWLESLVTSASLPPACEMIRWREYVILGTRQMLFRGPLVSALIHQPQHNFHLSLTVLHLTTSKQSLDALSAFSLPLQSGHGGGWGEVLCRQKTMTNKWLILYISKDSDVSQSHQSKGTWTVNHFSICQRFSVSGDSGFVVVFFFLFSYGHVFKVSRWQEGEFQK